MRRPRSRCGWLGRPPQSRSPGPPGIDSGRIAGTQIVGQQYRRRGQIVLKRPGLLSDQVREDPRLDVADIGGPSRQTRTRQSLQPGCVSLENIDNSMFRGECCSFDELASVAAQGRVADHAAVSSQDVGILRSEPGACFAFVLASRSSARLRARDQDGRARENCLKHYRAGRQPLTAADRARSRGRWRLPGLTA